MTRAPVIFMSVELPIVGVGYERAFDMDCAGVVLDVKATDAQIPANLRVVRVWLYVAANDDNVPAPLDPESSHLGGGRKVDPGVLAGGEYHFCNPVAVSSIVCWYVHGYGVGENRRSPRQLAHIGQRRQGGVNRPRPCSGPRPA